MTSCYNCEKACEQAKPYAFDEILLINSHSIYLCADCLGHFRQILQSQAAAQGLPQPLNSFMQISDTGVSLLLNAETSPEVAMSYLNQLFANAVRLMQEEKEGPANRLLMDDIQAFLRKQK